MTYSDSELIYHINEDNDVAKDILYKKYYYLLDIYVNKYIKLFKSHKLDENDLRQEALYAYSQAIDNYNDNEYIKTYLSRCIKNKLVSHIRYIYSNKNKTINNAISIEEKIDQGTILADTLKDSTKDPLTKLIEEEDTNKLCNIIKDKLRGKELVVINLIINGYSYHDIKIITKMNQKSFNNTIQRIRRKLKNIV